MLRSIAKGVIALIACCGTEGAESVSVGTERRLNVQGLLNLRFELVTVTAALLMGRPRIRSWRLAN